MACRSLTPIHHEINGTQDAGDLLLVASRAKKIGVPTPAEQRELEDFQKQVTARIPVPPGATDIADYP